MKETAPFSQERNKKPFEFEHTPLAREAGAESDIVLSDWTMELTSKVSTMSPNTCPRCLQSEQGEGTGVRA